METKICTSCGIKKNVSEFSFRNKSLSTRRGSCKVCHANIQKRIYHNKKSSINELKKSLSCAKCRDTRAYVLDFHHIDKNEKDGTVARMAANASWDRLEKEIAKCIILCANCHREFHFLENQSNLNIQDYLK
jgi:hypothetical protein